MAVVFGKIAVPCSPKLFGQLFQQQASAALKPQEFCDANLRGAECLNKSLPPSNVKLPLRLPSHNELGRNAAMDAVSSFVPDLVIRVVHALCSTTTHHHRGAYSSSPTFCGRRRRRHGTNGERRIHRLRQLRISWVANAWVGMHLSPLCHGSFKTQ